MKTVALDDKVLATLDEPKQMIAVTDAAGRVVGFYAPVGMEHAPQYAAAAAQIYPHKDAPGADDNGKRYTTAEVLDHLKALGGD